MRRRRSVVLLVGLCLTVLAVRALLGLRLPAVGVGAEWPRLVGVTIVNPGAVRQPRQTITMRDGRIASIAASEEGARVSMASLLENRYVLPGLIDLNVRVPPVPGLREAMGAYFLYAGVTTVRDVGNFDGDLASFVRDVDTHQVLWPRLVACAQVIEGHPRACPRSRSMRTAAEAGPIVDALVAAGAGCVRVHASLAPDLRDAVRAAAHARGLPLIEPASLAMAPGPAAAERAAAWLRELRTIRPDGTEAFTPTLLPWALGPTEATFALDGLWRTYVPRAYHAVIERQEQAIRALSAGCASETGDAGGCASAGAPPIALLVAALQQRRAQDARLVAGTGTPRVAALPGFAMHYEMQLLHGAGMSLEDVWLAATRAAGEVVGIPQLGVIETGAPADLLVFRDDPTQDLAALMTLEAVVMRGRLYLWQPRMRLALEYPRYFERRLYDWSTRARAAFDEWWNRDASRACEQL